MTLTTVGYGDVLPVTLYEKVYVCVAMAIGCAYFSYMARS